MRTVLMLGLLATATACVTRSQPSPQQIEAELQAAARTVVDEPTYTLFSPYDATATADFATVLGKQAELVRVLFEDTGVPPVRIYLVPVPAGSASVEDEAWRGAARDGFGGGAFREGFAFVYVSANPAAALMQATMGADRLRHELAHMYARRAALSGATWFNEGLAREVESMRVGADGLVAHGFPPSFIEARASARAGTVRDLVAWKLHDPAPTELRARRYAQAQALFRFLVDRAPGGTFVERAQAVFEMDEALVSALEPAWLDWLARLDALAAVRAGQASEDPAIRAECAAWMPSLAELGATELLTAEGDRLALEMLRDPGTCGPAATFLLFFRARALSADQVALLVESKDAGLCLTGLAVHARRGEVVDLERARSVWDRLSSAERTTLEVQRALLDLP